MSDPNPWTSVIPSVVTSAITTLVTMGIVGSSRAVSRRGALKANPLTLKRQQGKHWEVVNNTKRNLTGVSIQVMPESEEGIRPIDTWGGILYARRTQWVGALNEGDTVSVNWVTLGRSKARLWHSATARVRGDEDEFPMRTETNSAHNNGGA
jgi:hypothetical protein